jgi:hypothetical protein
VAKESERSDEGERRFHPEEILVAVLVILSIGGIAVTDFSTRNGFRYWLAMVPVFGGVSIFAGWSRARRRGEAPSRIVAEQVAHWAALAFAVYVVYLLDARGHLGSDAAGLVALLALALTTFLAGVHFDLRFCLLGLLLGFTVAAAALVKGFFWLLLLPALVVAAAALLWRRRGGR